MTEPEAVPEVQKTDPPPAHFTPDGSEMRWKFQLHDYPPVECEDRKRVRPTKAEVRLFHHETGPAWEIVVIGQPVTMEGLDAEKRHPANVTDHRFRQGLLVDLIIEIRANLDTDIPPAPPKPLDTAEDQAMQGLRMVYGPDISKWPKDTVKLARERGLLRGEEA